MASTRVFPVEKCLPTHFPILVFVAILYPESLASFDCVFKSLPQSPSVRNRKLEGAGNCPSLIRWGMEEFQAHLLAQLPSPEQSISPLHTTSILLTPVVQVSLELCSQVKSYLGEMMPEWKKCWWGFWFRLWPLKLLLSWDPSHSVGGLVAAEEFSVQGWRTHITQMF